MQSPGVLKIQAERSGEVFPRGLTIVSQHEGCLGLQIPPHQPRAPKPSDKRLCVVGRAALCVHMCSGRREARPGGCPSRWPAARRGASRGRGSPSVTTAQRHQLGDSGRAGDVLREFLQKSVFVFAVPFLFIVWEQGQQMVFSGLPTNGF